MSLRDEIIARANGTAPVAQEQTGPESVPASEQTAPIVQKPERDMTVREVKMKQGSTYAGEEIAESANQSESVDCTIAEPKKGIAWSGILENKVLRWIIFGLAVVVLVFIIAVVVTSLAANAEKQQGADFLTEEPEVPFTYTSEEREGLRVAGYTGDEIEQFQLQEASSSELITEMEIKRKQQYDDEILPYLDGASDAFKGLLSNTWVGLPSIVVGANTESYQYFNYTLNADYEKIPATGNQLFVKFYFTQYKTQWGFMGMTPERYLELPDSGNIVLNISYTEDDNGNQIVTDISEIVN